MKAIDSSRIHQEHLRMHRHYSIEWAGGERFGIAYAPEDTPLILLPEEGWVKSWEKMCLTLKGTRFADYLSSNLTLCICSEKLKGILEKCRSEKDALQWLDVEVVAPDGQRRLYYVLHFPVVPDVLDRKRTIFSKEGVLVRPIISMKAARDHEVFTYPGGGHITLIVSETVRSMIKAAKCTGLSYTCILDSRRRYLPKPIRGPLRGLFYGWRAARNKRRLAESIRRSTGKYEVPELQLPDDLVVFLREGMKLEYDMEKCIPGSVELVPLEELNLGRVYISSIESPFYKDDPHAGERGHYIVLAVDLIAECNGFNAWGTLVWLPDQQMYGTWDCDHDVLRVFPGATWTDIVANPVKYLNAQWQPLGSHDGIFIPWPKYPFTKEGDGHNRL